MKVIIAILFTLLYTAFVPFAVTGFAASNCYYGGCKTAAFYSKEKGEISTSSNESCTHQYAIAAHIHHKQINNAAGGNKYAQLNRLSLQPYSTYEAQLNYINKLYSKAVAQNSCPIFIKNCILLI